MRAPLISPKRQFRASCALRIWKTAEQGKKTLLASTNPVHSLSNLFYDFGIPIGGVVINEAIDKSEVGAESAEFIRNRVSMQDRYREEVYQSFEKVRGEIPLFEKEVRGLEMVRKLKESLFPTA